MPKECEKNKLKPLLPKLKVPVGEQRRNKKPTRFDFHLMFHYRLFISFLVITNPFCVSKATHHSGLLIAHHPSTTLRLVSSSFGQHTAHELP